MKSMMKSTRRKKQILMSWLLTYCLVLLVTVVSMVITYSVSKDALAAENVRNNILLLGTVQTEFDEILQKMEQNAVYLSKENLVRDIAENCTTVDNKAIYRLQELKTALQTYNGAAQKAVDYYVYFGNIDKAVSSNDIMYSAELSEKYRFDINVGEWRNLISADTGNNLVPLKTKEGENRYLYVMHSYYTNQFGRSNVSLVYILSERDFNFMAEKKLAGMNFYLQKNNRCTELIRSFPVEEKILATDFEKAVFRELGGEYLYSACKSDIWNVKYVILCNEKTVFAGLGALKKVYLAISVVTLLLGLSMAYYFARKNYDSIEKISDSLSVYLGENDDISTLKGLSEFTVNMVKNYTKVVSEKMSEQENIQKEYIEKILHKNYVATETLQNEMRQSGLEFLSEKFAVMVVRIADSVHMLMNYNLFANLIREVCSLKHLVTVVEENGFIVCLINFCKGIDNRSLEADITEMKNAICSVAKNGSGVDMSFASSGIVEGVDKIYIAFAEAMSVMDYKMLHNENDILFLKDIQGLNTKTGAYYSSEREKELIRSLTAGHTEAAQKAVSDIIRSVSNDVQWIQIGYRCLGYDIFSSLMKAAGKMGDEAMRFMIDSNIKFEAETGKIRTGEQYIHLLNEIVFGLCAYADKKEAKSLEDMVMEHIRQNYMNYDLSLTSIAETFGFHPVYLSSSFKSQCGEGINSRIETVRLDKAFELLESGESVSKTAEKVGYGNVQTFSKSFKRKYGITPSSINQKK